MVSSGSGQVSIVVFCEHGNEQPCPTKGAEFHEQLGDYQFLRKYSNPRHFVRNNVYLIYG
jgi:hypothetical protein